ncbi:unnamed protein product [Rotaria sordida]|uniref:Sulfotransferase n=1 Tax=Rotaria sordida TaxID=392033 RepID=A0A818WCF3_9BILA|nr:unnamed protein product [Rotaria sordida]
MPVEVIVAGLPRSGTLSMCEALTQLGYHKTMHMAKLIVNPTQMAVWTEIYGKHLEKTWTSHDWRQMFNQQFPEYIAVTDAPFCDFAVEIAQAYPEAKVSFYILSYSLFFFT